MPFRLGPDDALPPLRGGGLWALAAGVALARWLPHPWNFTPVGGFALFCGHAAVGWPRYAAPLAAVLAGDLLLGGLPGGDHQLLTMLCVYAGHLAAVEIGRRALARRARCSLWRVAAAALAASCVFFALTNAASWWAMYPRDAAGLAACFAAAMPFFAASLLANCLYGCAFVKGYAWLSQRTAPRHAPSG